MDKVKEMLARLRWLGHSSFRIDGPPTIYFDPWKLPAGSPPADLIFISHDHGDHCSPDDVAAIRRENTVIVANPSAANKLSGEVTVLRPGERTTIGEIDIQAVPAYNIDKFRSPGVPFHSKKSQHVGYVLTLENVRFYHTGDSDHIPEMAEIACDVALLPVSGKYVMTADEAVAAARDLQPQIAVPMHYGAGVAGTLADAESFRDQWEGEVLILSKTT